MHVAYRRNAMSRRAAIICLAVLCALALHARPGSAATDTSGVASLKHGYFCAMETVGTQIAEGTVSGTVDSVAGAPVFLDSGTSVPARLGVGFGVLVRVLPRFDGLVTVRVSHPPMGPDGVTEQEYDNILSSMDELFLGYTFDEPYEVLPGTWIMSAAAYGQVIYSVTFEVLDPALLPRVECGPVPVS